MDERAIQRAYFHKFLSSSLLIAPNIYFGSWRWECDIVRLMPSMYWHEVEVKISRADYKSEFKNKSTKHKQYIGNRRGPNYYSFAVPSGLIQPEEVSRCYGLYYCAENRWGQHLITVVRKPTRLHTAKVGPKVITKIARSLMFKFFNHGGIA
jgi:hypothetical protein